MLGDQIKGCLILTGLIGLATTLLGCGKLTGSITSLTNGESKQDFQRSEIITNGVAIADGTSELLVAIQLTNSDHSAVVGYRPTYSVTTGASVIGTECTYSNSHGVSTCILKATHPGTKTIQLTNAKVGLEKTVVFEVPRGAGRISDLSSGSQQKLVSTSGYKAELAAGSAINGIHTTTGRGYKVNVSLQGVISSR